MTFTRLLFKRTSFNCGNRPFRLVVQIVRGISQNHAQAAPQSRASLDEEEPGSVPPANRSGDLSEGTLKTIACFYSCPVHIDARKRSKGERPEAQDDDVRLAQRQRLLLQEQRNSKATDEAKNGFSTMLQSTASALPANDVPPATQQCAPPSTMLMDCTGDGFLEVSSDGLILRMLTSTALGYTSSELLGTSWLSICHPEDQAGLLQTMHALLLSVQTSTAHQAIQPTGASPRSLRVLHRSIVGLSARPQVIAVDTLLSVSSRGDNGLSPQTLYVCSRRALPFAADLDMFSCQVIPSSW